MCGIAGAFDMGGTRDFPRERLQAMTDALVHRGPDDQGHFHAPGVALAVRRLALVDTEHGHQPFSNSRKDLWAVCNAELYDHAELRAGLERDGHVLQTLCDAELWPHLYEQQREGMFEKARGQFAVALWDAPTRSLVLGRDRAGICPLHWAQADGWFLFASEAKALFASGLVTPRADRKAIDHLFTLLAAPRERTFFEGISSLPPAHHLVVRKGGLQLRRYWDLDFPDDPGAAQTAADDVAHALQNSVRRRLRADVDVASYLSGGVDSSLVLALANAERGKPLQAFTLGLDQAGPDDLTPAKHAAEVLGNDLDTTMLSRRDIADAFPALIDAAEGPVLDTSNTCLLRLAKRVHDRGFKIALTGEGADELFAGYPWYKAQRALSAAGSASFGLLPRIIRGVAQRLVGPAHDAHGPGDGLSIASAELHALMSRARPFIYSDAMWRDLEGYDPYAELKLPLEKLRQWHPLHQSLYFDFNVQLPGHLLLAKGDRVSMRASVEARYPFLDEDLISTVSRLPASLKLRGLRDKWLLREVAERFLPKGIAQLPKSMFRADLSASLLGEHRPAWVDELLSAGSLEKTGCFDAAKVTAERARRGTLPFSPFARTLDACFVGIVATQLFHHRFLGGGLCSLP